MIPQFEIIDENGNRHGPFTTKEQIAECVADRGLGEESAPDDESGRGWSVQIAKTS